LLVIAAATPQWPTHAIAAESQAAHTPPPAQETTLASLPPPSTKPVSSARPFGQMSVAITSGDVSEKWRAVQTEISAEAAVLERCRAEKECPAAARAFLYIVAQGREHDGLARIGVINRAVNLAIMATSDMKQWGVADRWSSPLETMTTGRGDCEDYAIAKYVALMDAGISRQEVKLVIVHNRFPDEEHAVVAVRTHGRWFILDNRSLALVPDDQLRGETPLFVLDEAGVQVYLPEIAGGIS
jgi:predicted transglutaminase-like cysteine proteinase